MIYRISSLVSKENLGVTKFQNIHIVFPPFYVLILGNKGGTIQGRLLLKEVQFFMHFIQELDQAIFITVEWVIAIILKKYLSNNRVGVGHKKYLTSHASNA